MIRIEDLSKDWKEFKLKHINLEVEDGEYFIILGPSGAGKSMLLELIAGIWTPDSGKIYMNQREVTLLPPEDEAPKLLTNKAPVVGSTPTGRTLAVP